MKFSVKQVQTIFRRWAREANIAGMDVARAKAGFDKAIRDYTREHLMPPVPENFPDKTLNQLFEVLEKEKVKP